VPETNFSVVKRSGENVLKLKSVKSTGAFLCDVTGKVNLRKTPLLSWRWKAVTLPRGGDGREGGTDDQAVAIYIGTGRVNYKAIGYRWETDTPKGVEETISYGFGRIKIKWFCLRNKTDDLGKWYVERRNIAKDFRKAFGYIPDKLAVSVAGNSQYSGTSAEAEVDWIEFLPLEKKLALRRRNP
jgi:hypothetical protein